MKKVIIIGATSGIGKALAKLFLSEGNLVAVTGRRNNLLQEMKTEHPSLFIKCFDISDTPRTIEKLKELTEELGGLDLLIISAGTGDINELLDFQIEKQTIETNAIGFTCAADWAFNYFQKQKTGHIAAITSVAGLRGFRHAPSYSATKAYQISYLESLRQKAASLKLPIFITDIRPGFIRTDMAKGDGLFWVATVDKAAAQILKAIKRKAKTVYITKRWKIAGVILKILPGVVFNKM